MIFTLTYFDLWVRRLYVCFGGPGTPSRTIDANHDSAFVENVPLSVVPKLEGPTFTAPLVSRMFSLHNTKVLLHVSIFERPKKLAGMQEGEKMEEEAKHSLRGCSQMTSDKILGFLTPSPLIRIWWWSTVLNPRNLPYYVCFWATPSPLPVRTSFVYGPYVYLPNKSNKEVR